MSATGIPPSQEKDSQQATIPKKPKSPGKQHEKKSFKPTKLAVAPLSSNVLPSALDLQFEASTAPTAATSSLDVWATKTKQIASEQQSSKTVFTSPDGLPELPASVRSAVVGWKRISELYGDQACVVSVGTAPPTAGKPKPGLGAKEAPRPQTPNTDTFGMPRKKKHHVKLRVRHAGTQWSQWLAAQLNFIHYLQQTAADASTQTQVVESSFVWDAIHPKSKDGSPKYNPLGKYFVRVYHQEEWRCLTIDDLVPVDANGDSVFPTSTIPNEVWPLLLSKAYAILWQGADITDGGSNVAYSLCGWLPQSTRITINANNTAVTSDGLGWFDELQKTLPATAKAVLSSQSTAAAATNPRPTTPSAPADSKTTDSKADGKIAPPNTTAASDSKRPTTPSSKRPTTSSLSMDSNADNSNPPALAGFVFSDKPGLLPPVSPVAAASALSIKPVDTFSPPTDLSVHSTLSVALLGGSLTSPMPVSSASHAAAPNFSGVVVSSSSSSRSATPSTPQPGSRPSTSAGLFSLNDADIPIEFTPVQPTVSSLTVTGQASGDEKGDGAKDKAVEKEEKKKAAVKVVIDAPRLCSCFVVLPYVPEETELSLDAFMPAEDKSRIRKPSRSKAQGGKKFREDERKREEEAKKQEEEERKRKAIEEARRKAEEARKRKELEEGPDPDEGKDKVRLLDLFTGRSQVLAVDKFSATFPNITVVYESSRFKHRGQVADLWKDTKRPFYSGPPSLLYLPAHDKKVKILLSIEAIEPRRSRAAHLQYVKEKEAQAALAADDGSASVQNSARDTASRDGKRMESPERRPTSRGGVGDTKGTPRLNTAEKEKKRAALDDPSKSLSKTQKQQRAGAKGKTKPAAVTDSTLLPPLEDELWDLPLDVVFSLTVERFDWRNNVKQSIATLQSSARRGTLELLLPPSDGSISSSVYRIQARSVAGYFLSAYSPSSSAAPVFLLEDGRTGPGRIWTDAPQSPLACRVAEGAYPAQHPNAWFVLCKYAFEVGRADNKDSKEQDGKSEPTLLSLALQLGDASISRYVLLTITNNDTKESSICGLLETSAQPFAPNESGYTITASCLAPRAVYSGKWNLRVLSGRPLLSFQQESVSSTSEYSGQYQNNHTLTVFRNVVGSTQSNPIPVSILVSTSDSTAGLLCAAYDVEAVELANASDPPAPPAPLFTRIGLGMLSLPPTYVSKDQKFLLEVKLDPLTKGNAVNNNQPLSWTMRIIAGGAVSIGADRSQEEEFNRIKAGWDKKDPSRVKKAKASRERFLDDVKAGKTLQTFIKQPISKPVQQETMITPELLDAARVKREAEEAKGKQHYETMVAHRDAEIEQNQKAVEDRLAAMTAWRTTVAETWSKHFQERNDYREKMLDQEAASNDLRAAMESTVYTPPQTGQPAATTGSRRPTEREGKKRADKHGEDPLDQYIAGIRLAIVPVQTQPEWKGGPLIQLARKRIEDVLIENARFALAEAADLTNKDAAAVMAQLHSAVGHARKHFAWPPPTAGPAPSARESKSKPSEQKRPKSPATQQGASQSRPKSPATASRPATSTKGQSAPASQALAVPSAATEQTLETLVVPPSWPVLESSAVRPWLEKLEQFLKDDAVKSIQSALKEQTPDWQTVEEQLAAFQRLGVTRWLSSAENEFLNRATASLEDYRRKQTDEQKAADADRANKRRNRANKKPVASSTSSAAKPDKTPPVSARGNASAATVASSSSSTNRPPSSSGGSSKPGTSGGNKSSSSPATSPPGTANGRRPASGALRAAGAAVVGNATKSLS